MRHDAMHNPADSGTAGALSILLVGDTRADRLLLETFLRQQGHRVRTAADAGCALERFDPDEIDLVLMDLVLPELDGIDALRALKARCGQRWVPMILVSAGDTQPHVARALEAGADDFLFKPIPLAVLAAKLRSLARIVQTTRSLASHRREAEDELALATAMIDGISRGQDGLRDPALNWAVHASGRFSGDAVAAVRTPAGGLVAMLADASGHGLPAAITLLPMLQVFYGMARRSLGVPEIAAEMNRRLKQYAPCGVYLAAALVAVQPAVGQAQIWNGGIPGGLWLRDGKAAALPALASRQLPLGILDEAAFDVSCAEVEVRAGGHLLFFSDGLLEATAADGTPFGDQRLHAQLAGAAPAQAFANLLQAVRAHLGGLAAHDDISLMMIALGGD
jgi:serine phosphatase RsbU (regulator of sigma subunit)